MVNQALGSGQSEREILMQQARLLGVEFSNNIGDEKLKARIAEKKAELGIEDAPTSNPLGSNEEAGTEEDFDTGIGENDEADLPSPEQVFSTPVNPVQREDDFVAPTVGSRPGSAPVKPATGKKLSPRQRLYNDKMKLVRVRIQNLDPKKADLDGEYLTIANKLLGTVKRFVPYGSVTDDGWHLPEMFVRHLQKRRFLHISTTRDKTTKQLVVNKRWAKEFSIEILDPLTPGELAKLAAIQAAAGNIESNPDDTIL